MAYHPSSPLFFFGWPMAVAVLLLTACFAPTPSYAFRTVYNVTANETTVLENSLGQRFFPVYVSVSIDRLLSVDPRLGQVQLAFQVITSWEDKSAKETTINTSRLLNLNTGPRVCVKPCDTIDNSQLCCEDIFTPAIHFANAVGVPTVNNKVLFGEDGTLSQISQVTGTFYQSFNLAYYPYSRFQVVIGLQLNAAQYSGPNLAAVLPVPYAINLQNRALGSGSEGWYISNPVLKTNRQFFRRTLQFQNLTGEFKYGQAKVGVANLLGVDVTNEDLIQAGERGADLDALLGYTGGDISISFRMELGSVELFVMTLPLAVLALFNMLVYFLPLYEAFHRFELSVIMFFTAVMLLGSLDLGGSNNQLNALQTLSIVVFCCLSFTVLSSMVLNSAREYRSGAYALRNDREMLLKRVHADILCADRICALEEEKDAYCNTCKGEESPESWTFKTRLQYDKKFRHALMDSIDHMCWAAVTIVYVVTFIVVPVTSSNHTVVLDPFEPPETSPLNFTNGLFA